jgi:hemoglobin-like flavoprotein
VGAFIHLETKRTFFEAPRTFFADIPERQPALSFLLTKMLEQNPQKRWTSMSELATALGDVAAGRVPEAVKRRANDDYSRKLRDNASFFDSFYRILFTSSPEICAIFTRRAVSMDQQYRKLDRAVGSLFSFDPSVAPTILDDHAKMHQEIGVKTEHFETFRAAFLDALRATKWVDAYSLDAWRAILDPAIAFMSEKDIVKVQG